MTEPTPYRDLDPTAPADRPAGTPGWVKTLGVLVLLLVLLIVVLHLTGNSLGGPVSHTGAPELGLSRP